MREYTVQLLHRKREKYKNYNLCVFLRFLYAFVYTNNINHYYNIYGCEVAVTCTRPPLPPHVDVAGPGSCACAHIYTKEYRQGYQDNYRYIIYIYATMKIMIYETPIPKCGCREFLAEESPLQISSLCARCTGSKAVLS